MKIRKTGASLWCYFLCIMVSRIILALTRLTPRNKNGTGESGNGFTIEPGIYIQEEQIGAGSRTISGPY